MAIKAEASKASSLDDQLRDVRRVGSQPGANLATHPAGAAAVHRIVHETCFTDVNNFKGPITATPVCTANVADYLQAERPGISRSPAVGKPPASHGVDAKLRDSVMKTIIDMRAVPKENKAQWANSLREEVHRLSLSMRSGPLEHEALEYKKMDAFFGAHTDNPGLDIEVWNVIIAWRDDILYRARVVAGTEQQFEALDAEIHATTRQFDASRDETERDALMTELEALHKRAPALRGGWVMQDKAP